MALKSTQYQKVEPAALNRRAFELHRVNISGASVPRSKKHKVQATILDISIYGCRLELDTIVPAGENIQIHLANTEVVDARIIWQKASEAGCRFAEAISRQKVKALAPSG